MPPVVRRLLLAVTAMILLAGPAVAAERTPLILISFDGFRADYLDKGLTPTLTAIAAEGAWAGEGMRPSFPANTYPNHYTLITGLRPDHHGLTDNIMVDPERPGVTFSMGARDQVADRFWWDGGEPVWVTAERAGLRTAPMDWPGTEAPVGGLRPAFWSVYDQTLSASDRVDRLLGQIDLPAAERPVFMTLYLEAVDSQGHWTSPDGEGLHRALAEVDAAVARLVAGLKARGLYDKVNLVFVADHGMAEVSPERVLFVEDLAPSDAVTAVSLGTISGLIARTPAAEAALVGKHPHVECWRKEDLPARFHYGTHRRIPPIICLPETGWILTSREAHARSPMTGQAGKHGFDPYDMTMRALFIARGPAIKPGVVLPVFDNVSVYPLLMTLLGVTPRPNDGHLDDVAAALR